MRVIAKRLAVGVLIASVVGCGGKTGGTADAIPRELEENRREITLQVRDPRNWGTAIRIRLDVERLHDYDLSADQVMEALRPSGLIINPTEPSPPPGVLFDDRPLEPDQYKEIILRANAEGDIVRLKDVAAVEVEPRASK